MRLLFVLPEYLPRHGGGIVTFYRTLLPKIVASGHEVHVLVGSAYESVERSSPFVIDGVTVDFLERKTFEKHLRGFSAYAATPALRRHLAAAWATWEQALAGDGFDVVEATDWGLLFVPWLVRGSKPVVVQMHGSCGQIGQYDPVAGEELQGMLFRMIERQLLPGAQAIQTYSEQNRDFWRTELGVSVDLLPPAFPLPIRIANEQPTTRGLVVGRVQQWKGPQILCEAVQILGGAAPEIEWVGRDTVFLEKGRTMCAHLARTYPDAWGRKILHSQQQPPEAIARLQRKASFVAVPSTWDVFNFTCIEAMAMGAPVICSTGAGASTYVMDGKNGLVFENGNARSLADALRRMLCFSDRERSLIGDAARETVAEEFMPERVASLRLEAFKKAETKRADETRDSLIGRDNWLSQAVSPGKGLVDEQAWMLHQSAQQMAKHLGGRIWRKISRR